MFIGKRAAARHVWLGCVQIEPKVSARCCMVAMWCDDSAGGSFRVRVALRKGAVWWLIRTHFSIAWSGSRRP